MLFGGLSLDLEAGAALHVAGPNGIGKSSLLRILAGLLRPDSGSVESTGAIGLIDERAALDPALPLGQALAFWQRLDGPADSELVRLGLAELLDVPVRYLSTGQRKRAAFARLLGQQAGIWLLDEPLNGLDARAGGLVQKLAAEHCEAGGICVIASHQSFALPGMARLELGHYAPPLQGRSSETWQAEGEPSRSGVGRLPQSQREMDSPHPNRFREGEGLS